MGALVDTNILVYRFDPRFPSKQARATDLLRAGIADDSIRVSHQALIEFIAATTKPLARNGASLVSPQDARRELEEMCLPAGGNRNGPKPVDARFLPELVRASSSACRDSAMSLFTSTSRSMCATSWTP